MGYLTFSVSVIIVSDIPVQATFGFNSCIMDRLPYRVSRIVIW
jgi:hypothetical protein